MSKHLQHQIEALKQKILLVGTLVEDAIAKAISALVNRNGDLARAIIERDDEIDRMEVDVEEECLKVLALYQPVAADLRFVVAVLKINNDLERMGDLVAQYRQAGRLPGRTRADRIAGRIPRHGGQGASDGPSQSRCAGESRHAYRPANPR